MQFQFLLTADDRRFFSSEAVEKEQILFGQAQVKTDYDNDWQSTFTLEYLYQDQVLDVSVTETALDIVKVIYAEYEYERTVSNLRLDEYSVNTILGGLIWEF